MFFKIDNSSLVFDDRHIQIDKLSIVKIIADKMIGSQIRFKFLNRDYYGTLTDVYNSYDEFLEAGMMMIYSSKTSETDSTPLFKSKLDPKVYWISFEKIDENYFTSYTHSVDEADYLAIYKVNFANPSVPPQPIIIRRTKEE